MDRDRFHDLAWIAVAGAIAAGIWLATPGEDPVNKAAAGDRIQSRLNASPEMYFGPTAEQAAIILNGTAEGIE